MIVEDKIDYYRKLRSLTVEELAITTGISRVHLQNLKAGRKGMSMAMLERIAIALKCSVKDLVEENEVPSKAGGYEGLEVWQLSIQLAKAVYQTTKTFPKEEQYGLTNQMRRAAVSIASNIAEGSTRTKIDFARFISIAIGSNCELKTQLIIAKETEYLQAQTFTDLASASDRIGKMLKGLQRSLKETNN